MIIQSLQRCFHQYIISGVTEALTPAVWLLELWYFELWYFELWYFELWYFDLWYFEL